MMGFPHDLTKFRATLVPMYSQVITFLRAHSALKWAYYRIRQGFGAGLFWDGSGSGNLKPGAGSGSW